MRKFLMLVGLVVALAIPAAALAADFDQSKFGDLISAGDKCTAGAYYHFVNVQTEGAARGSITVDFSPAGATNNVTQLADKVNPNNQHFLVFSTYALVDAISTLPGRLVLSDITCKK
jgi:hypothetical protein